MAKSMEWHRKKGGTAARKDYALDCCLLVDGYKVMDQKLFPVSWYEGYSNTMEKLKSSSRKK